MQRNVRRTLPPEFSHAILAAKEVSYPAPEERIHDAACFA